MYRYHCISSCFCSSKICNPNYTCLVNEGIGGGGEKKNPKNLTLQIGARGETNLSSKSGCGYGL